MLTSYYYFAASLPHLQFDGVLPLTLEKYLTDCDRLLSKKDASLIRQLFIEQEKGEDVDISNNEFAKVYNAKRNLKNLAALFRAQQAGKDPLEYIRGDRFHNEYIYNIIQQAAKEENLYTAEKMLDHAAWQYIDDLTMGHLNDLIFFGVYALKLAILERYQEFHSPKGGELFEEYLNRVQQWNCMEEGANQL